MTAQDQELPTGARPAPGDHADHAPGPLASVVTELRALNAGSARPAVPRILAALGRAGALAEVSTGSTAAAEHLAEALTPLQAAAVVAHAGIAVPALDASDRVRALLRRELSLAARGEYVFGFPLRDEPSDLRASRQAGGVVLTGISLRYPGAAGTDGFLVPFLPPDPAPGGGRAVAVVPSRTAGLRLVGSERRWGTADVALRGVFVPDSLVATVGHRRLVAARLWLARFELTLAERLLTRTYRHLGTRRSFGKVLTDHQSVRFRLAEHLVRADGVRALIETADEDNRLRRGRATAPDAAELLASGLLRDVTADCLHLYGASGQVAGEPVHRLLLETRMLAADRAVERRAAHALPRALGWSDER